MKNIIPFLLIAIFIFNTCKENEPTAPEEKTPQEILAETTIGPEGGTLETEDFKLTVPSGAFSQTAELSLYLEEKDSVNENSVTPLYVIEGIPENYSEPMQLSLRYAGSASGILYIEREVEIEADYFDSTYNTTVYKLFDATEENGFLKTTLPAYNENATPNIGKIVNDKNKISLEGFINGSLKSSQHFKIKSVDFPLDKWGPQYQVILNQFESFYNRYKDLGIDVNLTKWPKEIYAHKREVDIVHIPCAAVGGDLYTRSSPGLDISEYLWFCDVVLSSIILEKYEKFEKFEWFFIGLEASFLQKYDDFWKSNYIYKLKRIKSIISNSYKEPFNYQFIESAIEYLMSRFGESIIKEALNKIEKNNMNPILALTSNNRLPKFWLGDFHRSFLIDQLWLKRLKLKDPNYSMIDFCKENWSGEFGIEDTTTVIKWTETYQDLSGKLFRVNLLPGLNEESGLKFTVEGGDAEISLLKYKGSEIEFITSSEETDSISNIKTLADNGYQLIALVSNRMPDYPNFTTSSIELKIEHKNVKPLPKITSCLIQIENVDVIRRTYDKDGNYSDQEYTFWANFNTQPEPEITFENNILYQAYSYTNNLDYILSGNVSIEFSKNLDTILTFSVFHKEDRTFAVSPDSPICGIFEKGLSGFDIPLVNSYEKNIYKVEGLDVCERINNSIKWSSTGYYNWETIRISACGEQSNLRIEITKK